MLDTSAYDPYEIVYNEEAGCYDLFIDGKKRTAGSWEKCLKALREEWMNDPKFAGSNMDCMLQDFLYCKEQDSDLNGFMVQDRVYDLQDNTNAIHDALQFAVDVLDIMRTAKTQLMGADPKLRTGIRCLAYNEIQELIDKTSKRLAEEGKL